MLGNYARRGLVQSHARWCILLLAAGLGGCSAEISIVGGPPADDDDGEQIPTPDDPPNVDDPVTPAEPGMPGAPLPACPAEPAHPSAMVGNTPSRSMRSVFDAPASPSVAWSLDLGGDATGRVALDRDGRAYFGVDGNDIDSALITDRIVAVELDGTIAWARDFDDPVATPLISETGDLLTITGPYDDRQWVRLSRGGEELSRHPLALRIGSYPAIRCGDTTHWRTFRIDEEPLAAVVSDVTGQQLWRSDAFGRHMTWVAVDPLGQSYTTYALGEHPYTQALIALDPTGVERWRFSREETYAPIGPAVGDDGTVYLVTNDNDVVTLDALSPDGDLFWSIAVDANPGYAPLVVAPDGTVLLRTFKTVHAIRDGVVLWERDFHQNLAFEMELSADGQVIVTSGAVFSLDLASGAERWSVEPDNPFGEWVCIDPMVITSSGVLFSTCDGTLHLVAD